MGSSNESSNKSSNNEHFVNKMNKPNKKYRATIYFFTTTWCGHCQSYKPTIEQIINKLAQNNDVLVKQIDGDDKNNLDIIKKYDISGFPSIIIDKNDNKPIKFEGGKPIDTVIDAIYN